MTTLTSAHAGRAILTMCLGVILMVTSDAISKWLVERYHPLQILLLRCLIAAPMLATFITLTRGAHRLRSAKPLVHVLRGLLVVFAAWCFFLALKNLPLDTAVTIGFTAPMFIAAISGPLLKERVGRDRWLAILVGFAGVLVIVRPGAGVFGPEALWPVGAAFFYGLVLVAARFIDVRDDFLTMTFWMSVTPVVFCLPVLFVDWPEPEPLDWVLFPAVAVIATLGTALLSQAFRLAPAAVVAPFDYTALIWASLFGWLIWGTVPSIWTYLGAGVIVACGLYLMFTERRARRLEEMLPDPGRPLP
ncbi:DMT family transporter [Pelagovum pacificum]|uniref:DMT family transporter n=1 Tax=Pelagovum pacificum TaxID=2588711 RepID=A0A5C5GA52_9RHOB|nr:DMT family transporter [Pelagovum pacificum]QQA41636.1 DMT family transporter [Pelagovum pacificum]TNY30915.1 DMT family transporter [Pelagovum pacificum]